MASAKLDHASLAVRHLPGARAFLAERLGFDLTPTPESASSHGRIFLDRGYIEIAASQGQATEGRVGTLLRAWTHYFLGTNDARSFAADARQRGLPIAEPALYRAADGAWLDVSMAQVGAGRLLPTIVQRIEPPLVAANWPPPLRHPHPNGATTLAAIYIVAAQTAEATGTLAALLGDSADPLLRDNALLGLHETALSLPDGKAIIFGRPHGRGPARRWHAAHGDGPCAVAFGTPDLAATRAFLAARGVPLLDDPERAALWIEPHGEVGAAFGFVAWPP